MTCLSDLLELAARSALATQRADGSFPPGQNGPYQDPETPVRTTAHWVILLSHVHDLTGAPEFERGVRRAVGYLLSPAARPGSAGFVCRIHPHKDACNGLMGQAWAIEALATAGHAHGETAWIDTAVDVFLAHPFDETRQLWRMREPDGSVLGFDTTFNHQLWFAAAGGLLSAFDDLVRRRVVAFLDGACTRHLRTTRSGRIRHVLWFRKRNLVRHPVRTLRVRRQMPQKEIGYQSFNLYAMALLCRQFPEHALWRSKTFQRAVDFIQSTSYQRQIEDNPFGYSYNPPGFELAYALQVFRDGHAGEAQQWVERQLAYSWDAGLRATSRSSPDPATAAARFYEAARLDDVTLRTDVAAVVSGGTHGA